MTLAELAAVLAVAGVSLLLAAAVVVTRTRSR